MKENMKTHSWAATIAFQMLLTEMLKILRSTALHGVYPLNS